MMSEIACDADDNPSGWSEGVSDSRCMSNMLARRVMELATTVQIFVALPGLDIIEATRGVK